MIRSVCVVDVETTGLDPAEGHRICEVGIVRVEDGEIVETFESLVNPQRPLPEAAARINGLTDEMLREAPTFDEIAPRVGGLLAEADMVAAYNAPFDMGFLRNEFTLAGATIPPCRVFDILAAARLLLPLRSRSLQSVSRHFGIRHTQSHRALDDAADAARVMFRLAALAGGAPVRRAPEVAPLLELYAGW